MATHPDVVIAGGGVIGLTTAYYLAKEGASVSVLDRGDFGHGASWAGAGILPTGDPDAARTPLARFRAVSSSLFPALSQALREETEVDNGYRVCGEIELDAGDALTEAWRDEGIAFEAVDAAELRRLEPGLSPDAHRGYHLPATAQVRNPRHVKALVAACEELAVGLMPSTAVRALARKGDRVLSLETDLGRVEGAQFLVTAGAWTDALLRPLGWHPGIKPIRGQIALLNNGHADPRPIVSLGKRYIVPRGDGHVLIGSTEEDAGFDPHPTAGGIAGLLAFAEQLLPGLAGATLERSWAGLRPSSPDEMPYLGAVPGVSNVFVAAGHFRSGIQLSPATGMVMSELLRGRPTTIPLLPFRPDRSVATV